MEKKKLLIVTSIFEIPEIKYPEIRLPQDLLFEDKPKKTKCKRK